MAVQQQPAAGNIAGRRQRFRVPLAIGLLLLAVVAVVLAYEFRLAIDADTASPGTPSGVSNVEKAPR